ncbi:hypothetical protein [Vibrio caribbeanicus]|uniref:hypothetical protein n=1 Tax=Vibrio caribbeanicus TaxID=701175 RepID=UPI0030DC120E
MIIINSDSLHIGLDLLKSTDFNTNIVFYNDGMHNHQIQSFKELKEDFEVNGVLKSSVTSYCLTFINSDKVEFYFESKIAKFCSHKLSLPKNDIGTPKSISKFTF